MANHYSHAGLPFPVKNARYTVLVPYLDADGDPTDPTTPDTEISKDGAAFADCAEEVTTISGARGSGYITLTGAEMDCTVAMVVAQVASGPKATLLALSPQVLPVLYSGTAASGGANTLTLASDVPQVDDLLKGCILKTTGGTGGGGTGGANNQARIITGFAGSSRQATVTPSWETTPDGTTTYEVLVTERSLVRLGDTRLFGGAAGTFSGGRPEVNTTHAAGTAWASGAITAAAIASDAITAAKIASGAITAAKFGTDAITSTVIAANAIGAAQIADGAIDALTFAAGAINAAAIATDAITAAKIANGAIDAATFAAGAIDSTAIASGAIGSTQFAGGAITAAVIASDAITAAKIADGAIDAATFAAGAITSTVLATNAITAGAIASSALTNAKFNSDTGLKTLASGTLQAATSTTAQLDLSQPTTVDLFAGALFRITSGTGLGQAPRLITAYAADRTATVTPAFVVTPDVTTAYVVTAAGAANVVAMATSVKDAVADAVWDEAIAGHLTSGTTGAALNGAGAAGDPWGTTLPGAYGAGTAGKIVGDNVNATISSRATQTTADAIQAKTDNLPSDPADHSLVIVATDAIYNRIGAPAGASVSADVAAVKTDTAAIKTKTDSLTFTTANQVDARTRTIDATPVDTIWDEAIGDSTITGRQAMKILVAVLAGKLSGAATTTISIRNAADNANVVVATVDADGNRSAVTLTV